jgi:hypothetical protein
MDERFIMNSVIDEKFCLEKYIKAGNISFGIKLFLFAINSSIAIQPSSAQANPPTNGNQCRYLTKEPKELKLQNNFLPRF